MKNITVYMGPMCGYCDAAKRLLARNNITYKEINIALEEGKMDEMLKKSNGKKTSYPCMKMKLSKRGTEKESEKPKTSCPYAKMKKIKKRDKKKHLIPV